MKQFLLKIQVFIMALMVLFSSLSYNVIKHYCAGKVASVSYFVEEDSCAMDEEEDACYLNTDLNAHENKICCNTEVNFVDGIDFVHDQTDFTLNKLQVYTLDYSTSFSLFQIEIYDEEKQTLHYSPPIVVTNKVVLYETYRI